MWFRPLLTSLVPLFLGHALLVISKLVCLHDRRVERTVVAPDCLDDALGKRIGNNLFPQRLAHHLATSDRSKIVGCNRQHWVVATVGLVQLSEHGGKLCSGHKYQRAKIRLDPIAHRENNVCR